jgi:outer membrane protein assembly factor BamA
LRYFGYPDPLQKYSIVAGKATKHGDFFDGDYVANERFGGLIDLRLNLRRDEDPFERFYGFGNETPDGNETNYTGTFHRIIAYAGYNFFEFLRGSFQFRFRHVRVGSGEVDDVENLRDSQFNDVEGINGATIVGTRFGLSVDTRDRDDIPSEGYFGDVAVEVVDKALGASDSFIKYGLEAKGFLPIERFFPVPEDVFVLALHMEADYMTNGGDAPFYERNTVGGTDSLRSEGRNRFTDKHRFVMQAELRSRVYSREIFGVQANIELAPFLDFGKVFKDSKDFPLTNLHAAGGLGVRAVVVPQVVAFVDVGTGGDTPAVFTGIDYPF